MYINVQNGRLAVRRVEFIFRERSLPESLSGHKGNIIQI
jgi:hypothetical protein